MSVRRPLLLTFVSLVPLACGPPSEIGRATAFTGMTVYDGTAAAPVSPATIVVRDGRIEAVGAAAQVAIPDGATVHDLAGRYVTPGFINAHGHVGGTRGLEGGHYTAENLERQLRRYARYGVTTVVSLGGDGPAALPFRTRQSQPGFRRARLYIAGEVITGDTPAEALAVVARNVDLGVDYLKFRVDDNLGTTEKMSPEVYEAVLARARELDLQVATHLYYLADAKALLRAGTGFVAHSIRDRPVDDEVIRLFHETGVCYTPTLTREVSTFVYESEPAFFSDPYFLAAADSAVLEQLLEPERQAAYRASTSAQAYKAALSVAEDNLVRLADAGVTIAMGTDTGPPARFQGYFEHLEMEMMQAAGLSPMDVLRAATGNAAACLRLAELGVLAPGYRADFVVLTGDPAEDARNLRTAESVWVAGDSVPDVITGRSG